MGRDQQLTDRVPPDELRSRPHVAGSHCSHPAVAPAHTSETVMSPWDGGWPDDLRSFQRRHASARCARSGVVIGCFLSVTRSPICRCSLNSSCWTAHVLREPTRGRAREVYREPHRAVVVTRCAVTGHRHAGGQNGNEAPSASITCRAASAVSSVAAFPRPALIGARSPLMRVTPRRTMP